MSIDHEDIEELKAKNEELEEFKQGIIDFINDKINWLPGDDRTTFEEFLLSYMYEYIGDVDDELEEWRNREDYQFGKSKL